MKQLVALGALFTCASASFAQEVPRFSTPTEQHAWLKKFAGEWETTSKTPEFPGQPAMECAGAFRARMIGELWLINDVRMEAQGTTVTALQTIGYDTDKKKYVGTWVDSVMNHMWRYEGEVDKTGKKLTLNAEGPNLMAKGKSANYRDSYEFKSNDLVIMTSEMQMKDGKWVTFMTGTMKRKASAKKAP